MKPAPFDYHDPTSVEEAIGLLASHENAQLLAGGQSLMPMMNFRMVAPDHLVDLNRVEGLAGIEVDGSTLRFGAMTRQRDIELSPEVERRCPVLREALRHVGHCQTRNRGTIGGSICQLDPAAELVNIAALHDGTLQAESPRGIRRLSLGEFAIGYMTHALEPDELLTAVTLTPWSQDHGYAFIEVSPRRGDFAVVAVGILIELDENDVIRRAAIAVSCLGPVPIRSAVVEAALVGETPSHEVLRGAAIEIGKLEAVSDAHVTAAYRQHLARVLTYRALECAASRARARRTA